MKRQLTLAEYRSLDLTLFAVILAVCEYIMTLAAIRWYPGQLYTVSLSAALRRGGGTADGWSCYSIMTTIVPWPVNPEKPDFFA